jgi:aminoglycoside phosphotransferase (APT) family kinase protein
MPDGTALRHYLEMLGQPVGGPLEIELFSAGRSNLTYAVMDGTSHWIVRRPPLGDLLPSAHDMLRECAVMRALEHTAVPVPVAIDFCENPDVIGVPFLLMEFVKGRVIHGSEDAQALGWAAARRCSAALVDALVDLHSLEPSQLGLDGLGQGDGYLARQVRRWQQQWSHSMSDSSPSLDRLARLLEKNLPEQSRTALVHGDYRLGNVILGHEDPGRIAAIIDWEMATLGDPLADVGLLLAYWDPASEHVTAGGHPIAANIGFLDPEELVERYSQRSGVNAGALGFYKAFGYYKLAVIAQTIHARYLRGEAVGDGLESVGHAVGPLIEAGIRAATDAGLRS